MYRLNYAFLVFFLLVLPFYTEAQHLSYSQELNMDKDVYYEVLGKYGKDIIVLEETPIALSMRKLDENLVMSVGKKINIEGVRTGVIGYIPNKKFFNIVYASYEKDSVTVYQQSVDPAGNTIQTQILNKVYKPLVNPNFNLFFSENKEVAVLMRNVTRTVFELYGWNTMTGQQLYRHEIDFSKSPIDFSRSPLQVDNSGYIYFAFEGMSNVTSNRAMILSRLDAFNGQLIQQEIQLSNLFIADFKLSIDNMNKELNLVGLFSLKRNAAIIGSLFIKTNNTFNEDPIVGTFGFSKELLDEFHGQLDVPNQGLSSVKVKNMILRQDGGVLAILEDNKEYVRRNYSGRRDFYDMSSMNYTVDYYYEDLIAISYSPNGTVHWEKVLPKRQYSFDDDALFSSFFLMVTPKSIRLLYNDEIRNESTVSEYVLEGNGKIQRKALVSTASQNIKLQLRNSKQVGANELLIPSIKGRKLRFVRIIYPPEIIH